MTVQNTRPASLVAGDLWSWRDGLAYSQYPPDLWSVSFVLRPIAGGAGIPIAATAQDGAWLASLGASLTAAHAAGLYEGVGIATLIAGDARHVFASWRLQVKPDPTTATGDLRSDAERIVAAIDATLSGRASKDAESYSIEGRSIARTPIPDLMRLKTHYERAVQGEQNPGGSPITYRRIRQ